MKKILSLAVALSLLAALPAYAAPITYTFNPYDSSGQLSDINDLDHYKYYVWEINNFSLEPNQYITGATLTFTNIYDWQNENGDALYTHLMDSTPAGLGLSTVRTKTGVDAEIGVGVETYDTKLLQGTDNQAGGDRFAGMGTLITPVWSDPLGGLPANTVIYDFSKLGGSVSSSGNIVNGSVDILPVLESYLRNGNNISFAFDPDCHYYNDKVTFTITTDTRPVPEPGTLLLLGGGLVGLGLIRRKKNLL